MKKKISFLVLPLLMSLLAGCPAPSPTNRADDEERANKEEARALKYDENYANDVASRGTLLSKEDGEALKTKINEVILDELTNFKLTNISYEGYFYIGDGYQENSEEYFNFSVFENMHLESRSHTLHKLHYLNDNPDEDIESDVLNTGFYEPNIKKYIEVIEPFNENTTINHLDWSKYTPSEALNAFNSNIQSYVIDKSTYYFHTYFYKFYRVDSGYVIIQDRIEEVDDYDTDFGDAYRKSIYQYICETDLAGHVKKYTEFIDIISNADYVAGKISDTNKTIEKHQMIYKFNYGTRSNDRTKINKILETYGEPYFDDVNHSVSDCSVNYEYYVVNDIKLHTLKTSVYILFLEYSTEDVTFKVEADIFYYLSLLNTEDKVYHDGALPTTIKDSRIHVANETSLAFKMNSINDVILLENEYALENGSVVRKSSIVSVVSRNDIPNL